MIDKLTCQEVLTAALKTGGDFAELFAESTYSNGYEMTSGKVTKVTSNHTYGVSIRILKGYHEVNGYCNDFSRESLLALADKLAGSFTEEAKIKEVVLTETEVKNINPVQRYPEAVTNAEKDCLSPKNRRRTQVIRRKSRR